LPGSRAAIRRHWISDSSYRFTIHPASNQLTRNAMNQRFTTLGILRVL
jgi:hypothetical protein